MTTHVRLGVWSLSTEVADSLGALNDTRQGQFQGQSADSAQSQTGAGSCKLLKKMVPEVGVEPTRS